MRVGKDNKLKMLLSKKNIDKKNKYFPIQIIPDTITPQQFKQSVNVLRQNMNHIGSNDYIKRLNRKIKKLVRSDLTSHNLRGMYATYMFNEHNPDNQNINGYISKILNHDSDNSSLNYSNYIYEKTKNNEEKIEEIIEEKNNEEIN
jgi:integrase